MKFAIAVHDTRGGVEPCTAVGKELRQRGHEVRMAAPPDLVGFVESAGLAAVAYGSDSRVQLNDRYNPWKNRNPIATFRACKEYITQDWAKMSTTLTSLANGADLLLTGNNYPELAANVAEYYDIPFAALHWAPMRVNGHLVPVAPPPVIRSGYRAFWWVYWRMIKEAEDAQRLELGLRKATGPSERRITGRGSLEIQTYEEFFFPGLAEEWTGQRRPFVGSLTMQLTTDADEEVASWIAAGTPPIYFGFGSVPVSSPDDTVTMISTACKQLGERALIGGPNFSRLPHLDHVKLVDAVNFSAIFPTCRAVVHHGGGGTTAAGMRAGVPTLILWTGADQPIWGAQVKLLKVGSSRSFASITQKGLVAELRTILSAEYVTRAREVAAWMTKPEASVTATADLLEDAARQGRLN